MCGFLADQSTSFTAYVLMLFLLGVAGAALVVLVVVSRVLRPDRRASGASSLRRGHQSDISPDAWRESGRRFQAAADDSEPPADSDEPDEGGDDGNGHPNR